MNRKEELRIIIAGVARQLTDRAMDWPPKEVARLASRLVHYSKQLGEQSGEVIKPEDPIHNARGETVGKAMPAASMDGFGTPAMQPPAPAFKAGDRARYNFGGETGTFQSFLSTVRFITDTGKDFGVLNFSDFTPLPPLPAGFNPMATAPKDRAIIIARAGQAFPMTWSSVTKDWFHMAKGVRVADDDWLLGWQDFPKVDIPKAEPAKLEFTTFGGNHLCRESPSAPWRALTMADREQFIRWTDSKDGPNQCPHD